MNFSPPPAPAAGAQRRHFVSSNLSSLPDLPENSPSSDSDEPEGPAGFVACASLETAFHQGQRVRILLLLAAVLFYVVALTALKNKINR